MRGCQARGCSTRPCGLHGTVDVEAPQVLLWAVAFAEIFVVSLTSSFASDSIDIGMLIVGPLRVIHLTRALLEDELGYEGVESSTADLD
ncbi:MAG: hypothetical protein M3R38_17750 [Actinomycetota bacterium]|nr:hypothetical protein [Actinomycetota bacterium]